MSRSRLPGPLLCLTALCVAAGCGTKREPAPPAPKPADAQPASASSAPALSDASRGTVRVAAIQFHSVMGDPEGNRARLVPLIERAAAGGARIVVLPECAVPGYADLSTDTFWSSDEAPGVGYLPVARAAEAADGPSTRFFSPLAKRLGIYLTVPIIEASEGAYHNTVVLLAPDGEIVASHRKHLAWRVADDSWMTAGPKRATVVDTEYGRLGLMICYDVHALLSELGKAKAEIVLYSVAFFGPNTGGWFSTTLAYKVKRAGVALVLANWTFPDDPGWSGWGHSMMISREGKVLARAEDRPGEQIVFADVRAR